MSLPGGTWWALTWASLAAAGLAGMAETGAVIQEATPAGQYSVSSLYGLAQVTKLTTPPTATLNAWAHVPRHVGDLAAWLCVHLGFDLLFIAGYFLLAWTLLTASKSLDTRTAPARDRPARPDQAGPEQDPASRDGGDNQGPSWRPGRWLLLVLVVLNLAQAGLAGWAFLGWTGRRRDVPPAIAWALHYAAILKWIAALLLIIWLGYRVWDSTRVREEIRQIVLAVKLQRFSLLIVVLLGVIAVSRGFDVLEQMPDVERAWLTWPPSMGWIHLAAAAAAQLLLAFLLLYLGRLRVRRAAAKFSRTDDRPFARAWPWLLTPAVLLGLTAGLKAMSWAQVSWLGVIGVPLVMWGAALLSWLFKGTAASLREVGHETPPLPGMADRVRTVGDVLAVAVIAVAGLGLVRAFTAPALVVGGGYALAYWIAIVVGIAVAAAVWVAAAAASRATRWPPLPWLARWARRVEQSREHSLRPALAAVAPLLAADVLLIFVPLWTSHWLGVLGTAVIALGTLAIGLAYLAYLAQNRRPLALFRLLRLNATPVITLLVLIGIAGIAIDKSSRLHEIRPPEGQAAGPAPAATAPGAAGSADAGPAGAGPAGAGPAGAGTAAAGTATAPDAGGTDLVTSLQQWLADPLTTSCAVPALTAAVTAAAGTPRVRVEPLVLVAAAGGGIRAAWWTTHALAMLIGSDCGRHAVFAVSSVSGSSVGMGVLATMPRPDVALSRIAGPDALAAVIDGLVLRDTIAGFTGLNLTAAQMPPGQRFPDRAALMEHAWEAEDSGLRRPFPLSQPVLPWRLLFNSTAVRTGCRAILADRSLAGSLAATPGPAPAAAAPLTCGLGSAAPAANSYDLFAKLPCLRGIDTATAALLSARFPFVTPSGVVNGCQALSGTPAEQFVDGGYADSSGLATLAGLAPGLMAAVRQYNSVAVAGTQAGQAVTLVVPVTVYLGNSPQVLPPPSAPGGTPELLTPVLSGASGAKGKLVTPGALLQQLAGETSDSEWLSCAPGDDRCTNDSRAAAAIVSKQLVAVVPQTQPRVSAPLGWILSKASRDALNAALQHDATSACEPSTTAQAYCPAGVGGLRYLLRLIPQ